MPTTSFCCNRRNNLLFYSLMEERLAESYIYTVAVRRQWLWNGLPTTACFITSDLSRAGVLFMSRIL